MFVSFLTPSIFPDTPARHLLVFYKQLTDYGRGQVAFVGIALESALLGLRMA